MINFFLLSTMVVASLALSSCDGNKKDAATYNNQIITVINSSEAQMNEMNSAMTTANYTKAEETRAKWDKQLDTDIKKVEEIGDFNGDVQFQTAVLNGLKGYKKIVTDSYPKLIEMRKNNISDPTTENKLLNDINAAFENMANGVNKASTEFESKYHKQ